MRTGGFVDKIKRIITTWPLLSVVNCFQVSGLNIYIIKKVIFFKEICNSNFVKLFNKSYHTSTQNLCDINILSPNK